jgi:hypothetical protein
MLYADFPGCFCSGGEIEMSVKPVYLIETIGGGLMVYAAVKNYTFSSIFSNLLKGKIGGQVNTANGLGDVSNAPTTSTSNPAGGGSVSANDNFQSIGLALVQNFGYSNAAAAGICACIDGESGGDPESVGTGGCGLIGWTPPSSLALYGGTCAKAGIGVTQTSNPTAQQIQADLDSQISAVDKYNRANGNVSALNAQTNPVNAADYYSQNFERPAVTDSDVRVATANSVYSYLQGAAAQQASGATQTANAGASTGTNIGHG